MDPRETMQTQLDKARRGELSLEELKALDEELKKAGMFHEALEVAKTALEVAKTALEVAMTTNDSLRKKLKRGEYVLETTLEKVYWRNNGPSFPPLSLRRDVQPSVEAHQLKGMDPQRASYLGGISGSLIWNQLSEVVVPTCVRRTDDQTLADIRSNFDPQEYPLQYENEIDIQVLCRNLVKDAIKCLGYQGRLKSSMELTFYGITPDILVVCRDGRIIFVMEVKAPDREQTNDNVMENELVGGQIWLYLMVMKQAGIDNPLGAICTFNKIRIVSLKDLAEHSFGEVMLTMTSNVIPALEVPSDGEKNSNFSPDPKHQQTSERTRRYDPDRPEEAFEADLVEGANIYKAQLYGGKIAETTEVFPMLLLALKTAYEEAQAQTTTLCPQLTEVSLGDDIGGRLFVFGRKDRIQIARTSKELKVKQGFPARNSTNFHLVSKIGKRSNGEVHLAVSTSGVAAAVKFYHCKRSREASPELRAKQNEEFRKEVDDKCSKELNLWNRLYPDRARKQTLGGVSCLLMPYGKPLAIGERNDCIEAVESELDKFWEAGYSYKDTDMLWRHVLRDLDGNVFLADLGSLVGKDEIPNGEKFFRELKEKFRGRANETTPKKESNGVHNGSH